MDPDPQVSEGINVLLDSLLLYQTFFSSEKASTAVENTERDGEKPRKSDGEKARKTKRKRLLHSRHFRKLLTRLVTVLLRALFHYF